MKFLLEIPITEKSCNCTCHTSVKIVKSEISYVQKGQWSDSAQDWEAIITMNDGTKFEVNMPIYKKLIAIE